MLSDSTLSLRGLVADSAEQNLCDYAWPAADAERTAPTRTSQHNAEYYLGPKFGLKLLTFTCPGSLEPFLSAIAVVVLYQ